MTLQAHDTRKAGTHEAHHLRAPPVGSADRSSTRPSQPDTTSPPSCALPSILPPEVRVVRADLAAPDLAVIESAVAGADAVLSGLGPRAEGRRRHRLARHPGHRRRDEGRERLAARRRERGPDRHAARRRPGRTRRSTIRATASSCGTCSAASPGPLFREHYADLVKMEDILRDSGLDWTVVRPPKLTDKAPRVRIGRPSAAISVAAGRSPGPMSPTACSECSTSRKRSSRPSVSPSKPSSSHRPCPPITWRVDQVRAGGDGGVRGHRGLAGRPGRGRDGGRCAGPAIRPLRTARAHARRARRVVHPVRATVVSSRPTWCWSA